MLKRLFNRQQYLTPETIGVWIITPQREIVTTLLHRSFAKIQGLPDLELSNEAMAQLSTHSYALHIAIVTSIYRQVLNDSRFLHDGNRDGVNFEKFVERLHLSAKDNAKEFLKIGSKKFDPFPMCGCVLDIESVLSYVLRYHCAMFVGYDGLQASIPEAARFAKCLTDSMGCSNRPLPVACALAFHSAYSESLAKAGSNMTDLTNPQVAAVMLRGWEAWTLHMTEVPRRVQLFHGTRKLNFE
jgi:hypothetical protein